MHKLRTLAGATLLLATSTSLHSATCSTAGDTITAPSGGFLHTLYNIDFETPTHTASTWPVEGLGPSEVGLYDNYFMSLAEAHKGLPEVVVQPLLDGQSAELNARPVNTDKLDYDDLLFQLGRAADYYTIEFDMVIDEHVNLTRTLIALGDMAWTSCSIVLNADNEIYRGGVLASYAYDTRYHFSLTLLPNGDDTGRIFLTISEGTSELYSGQLTMVTEGNDFGLFKLRGQGYEDPDNNYAQVDNIVIKAAYTDLPTLPPADTGDDYVLDFNAAESVPPHGVFWVEDGFGLLFGDNQNNVYSADDSAAMRFSSSTRPTLVHQLGLPFTLKQLDLGEYSTVVSSGRTTTFTGYKYDGTEVTRDFTTDGVVDGIGGVNDMELVTFDESWTNLRGVQFESRVAVDNVVVSVDADIDEDDVHDWLDACLPEQAAAAAVENAVERNDGCPRQNNTTEEKSSGGSIGYQLLPLLLLFRRKKLS